MGAVKHAAWLMAAVSAAGQELIVYPEFQRPTPQGEILKVDQNGRRREILSPAVVQNGFASYFVVVKLREPGAFRLDIAMNPEDRIEATLYKVRFHQPEGTLAWCPAELFPVQNTVFGMVPDAQNGIPGQTAAVFWLDLWTARGKSEGEERVRVEAQLTVGDRLDVYPLEVRILPIVVSSAPRDGGVAEVTEPAWVSIYKPLRAWLSGTKLQQPDASPSVRRKIVRNALQDLALLDALEPRLGRDTLRSEIARRSGAFEGLDSDWWPEIRRWIYARHMEAASAGREAAPQ